MKSIGNDAARMVLLEFGSPISEMRLSSIGGGGGMSGALLWKVSEEQLALPDSLRAHSASDHDTTWCLRCWPAEHPSSTQLMWIHTQLITAVANGCGFIAAPRRTGSGQTIVQHASRLWELSPWLPGHADFYKRPARERLRQASRALAELHQALQGASTTAGAPAPALKRRSSGLAEFSSKTMRPWMERVDTRHGDEICDQMKQILTLLPFHWDVARERLASVAHLTLPVQPVLRDVWHDHLLFVDDRLTGIIDYGAMQIDAPASDLARMLGSLVRGDMESWRFALAEYAAIRPLQIEELAVLAPLDRCNIVLAAANWWRWLFVEGRKFSSLQSVKQRLAEIGRRLSADSASPDGFPPGFA